MKKYKMLIFDMDGTILYTLEDLKNTTNYALSEHGFPERTLEEVQPPLVHVFLLVNPYLN